MNVLFGFYDYDEDAFAMYRRNIWCYEYINKSKEWLKTSVLIIIFTYCSFTWWFYVCSA